MRTWIHINDTCLVNQKFPNWEINIETLTATKYNQRRVPIRVLHAANLAKLKTYVYSTVQKERAGILKS